MLIRYGGAKSGIIEYLEEGHKKFSEYSREELDTRIPLIGDIRNLENVIESIPDRDQEKYMHITLSFSEDDISQEKMMDVLHDYLENTFLGAYKPEELCLYAEAHLPKIKEVKHYKTGEIIKRKPHIHLVIPKVNLLNWNMISPVGMVKDNLRELDSIQEYLNAKHNLISPNDKLIDKYQDKSIVDSYWQAKHKRTRSKDLKKKIHKDIIKSNIRNQDDFKKILSKYGEVREYNKGKVDNYFGVKEKGKNRFVRLKEAVFLKNYIEKRNISLSALNAKELKENVEKWRNITSKEIKYIRSNPSNRKKYRALKPKEKTIYLKEIEDGFYSQFKDLLDDTAESSGRKLIKRDRQRRKTKEVIRDETRKNGYIDREKVETTILSKRSSKRSPTRMVTLNRKRLLFLQEGDMVYGKEDRGKWEGKAHELKSILRPHLSNYLEEKDEIGGVEHRSGNLRFIRRWSDDKRGRRLSSLTRSDEVNNYLDSLINEVSEEQKIKNSDFIKELREKTNPERLLAFCHQKFRIDVSNHKISKNKKGEYRIRNGNKNLNPIDFLRSLHIDLEDALNILVELQNDELVGKDYEILNFDYLLTKDEFSEKQELYRNFRSDIQGELSRKRSQLFNHYNRDKQRLFKDINRGNYKDKQQELKILKSALDFELIKSKRIRDNKLKELREVFQFYSPNRKQEIIKMAENIKLKSDLFSANSIRGITELVEEKEELLKKLKISEEPRRRSERKKVIDIEDLFVINKGDRTVFVDQSHKTCFVDNGKEVDFKGNTDKDEMKGYIEYAVAKFKGQLTLKGSKKFKEEALNAIAESGHKVILKPKGLNVILEKKKEELALRNAKVTTNISSDKALEKLNTFSKDFGVDKEISKVIAPIAYTKYSEQQEIPIEYIVERLTDSYNKVNEALEKGNYKLDGKNIEVLGVQIETPYYLQDKESLKSYLEENLDLFIEKDLKDYSFNHDYASLLEELKDNDYKNEYFNLKEVSLPYEEWKEIFIETLALKEASKTHGMEFLEDAYLENGINEKIQEIINNKIEKEGGSKTDFENYKADYISLVKENKLKAEVEYVSKQTEKLHLKFDSKRQLINDIANAIKSGNLQVNEALMIKDLEEFWKEDNSAIKEKITELAEKTKSVKDEGKTLIYNQNGMEVVDYQKGKEDRGNKVINFSERTNLLVNNAQAHLGALATLTIGAMEIISKHGRIDEKLSSYMTSLGENKEVEETFGDILNAVKEQENIQDQEQNQDLENSEELSL